MTADLQKGQTEWVMSMTEDDCRLFAAYWGDVGNVKLMSNFHGPAFAKLWRREKGKRDKAERDAPTVAIEYNLYMGGTDGFDFYRGMRSTRRASKKWWHTLFYFYLDAAMINAWVLHKYLCKKEDRKPLSRDD